MSKRLTIEEFIETLKQGGSGSSGSGGVFAVVASMAIQKVLDMWKE